MTLYDLLDQNTLEGWHKIQCWEDTDEPNIYYMGDDFPPKIMKKYGNRKIRYIFPYMASNYKAGITIELEEED